MKKGLSIQITGMALGICLTLFTGFSIYKLLTTKTPAQVTVQKTRDDHWMECMDNYKDKPGDYMQACFYYAIDMCKEHGCLVDPSMEPKK